MGTDSTERSPGESPTFETIELDSDGGPWRPNRLTAAYFAGIGILLIGVVYQWIVIPEGDTLVRSLDPDAVDWLYWVSLWTIFVWLVVPLARRRTLVRYHWSRLKRNRVGVISLVYLGFFTLVAVVGPHIVGPSTEPIIGTAGPREPVPSQPPVGFGIPEGTAPCGGELIDDQCFGTWEYPLGTTLNGEDVLTLIVHGANVALKIMVVVGTLMIPFGVAVGTIAGYVGGWVDEGLMRYVDLQQVLPGFFIVILLLIVFDGALLLLLLVFGLLNWGGIARLVRSDVLATQEEGFVRAAESSGAPSWRVILKHIVPNTSSTVITAITLQLPLIVILEATLAYLFSGGNGAVRASIWQVSESWGYTIALGTNDEMFPTLSWWVVVFPAAILLTTTLSLSLIGDALRDTLDPRMNQ